MKKTLEDLKRSIKVGTRLKMVYNKYKKITKENEIREVTKIQTNGFWLGESFFGYPPASLLDFDGKRITIYEPGIRDLTEEERNVINNLPSRRKENKEIFEIDMMTDGNRAYWMDRAYTKKVGAEWFWGWSKGKRFTYNDGGKMVDKKIKGDKEREYIIL